MNDYPLRHVKIAPGLPRKIIRETFEGNLLWGILRIRLEDGNPDDVVELDSKVVAGEGTFAYSLGGGRLQLWIDAAGRSGSEVARTALEILRKGDDHHQGVFDLNTWRDANGACLVTVQGILKSILTEYGNTLDNDRFVVRVSPGLNTEEFIGAASFVTADHIDHVDLVEWIAARDASIRTSPPTVAR